VIQPEFLRYSCQISLPGFTETVQKKLQDAKVLIAGAGGLGCPCAQYLAAAGIGVLAIADDDIISISNLHRQILYTPAEAGLKKARVACEKLQAQNPLINIIPIDARITSENVMDFISQYDIIVDGTDNFDTKYLLNDACFLLNKPLVYGAIYQYEGQVAVWNITNEYGARTPNYRDVFPDVDALQIPDCAEGGVIPTLAGIIGCMQANEVIKYITGIGELLKGKMLILDAQTLQSTVIKLGSVTKTNIQSLQKTVTVPGISVKELKGMTDKNSYCLIDVRKKEERNSFHIGGEHVPLSDLEDRLEKIESDQPVIFYCASGKRSAEAVRIFMKKYPHIKSYSLEGGIKAWVGLADSSKAIS